jgi:hypothetical protein
MVAKHVKVISDADNEYFEKEYAKAISELGSKVEKVTFSTAAAQAEDDAIEVYYTAFIEY